MEETRSDAPITRVDGAPESGPALQGVDRPEEREDGEELGRRYRQATEEVLAKVGTSGTGYFAALAVTGAVTVLGALAWGLQLWYGFGLTGLYHPIMWGTYISNFIWWTGIAHSGTFISAALFLFRSPCRAAFSRVAEAMTLITALIASAYPIIHLGRAWRFYWLLPYPNQRDLWVTFQSPLLLDVVAVLGYLLFTALFFWVGLVPDVAILRDRSTGWRKTIYGLLSLGWEGTARQWKHHRMTYSLLACLAVPLVVFHSAGAWNLCLSILPDWRSTFFPPYFLAGAILSGLAMVLTITIPLRALLGLRSQITMAHLEYITRLIVVMSLLVTFSYLLESFMDWYAWREIQQVTLSYKAGGAVAPYFWAMKGCNSLVPLALLWPRVRGSVAALLVVALLINVGTWLERFVIITGSLGRDYIPYAWAEAGYVVSLPEWTVFVASVGWLLFCYLLFVRYLPVIPIAEIKQEILKEHREARAMRPAPGEVML
jgi:molybdopterin-containing oxidoreductase family membrane subunit